VGAILIGVRIPLAGVAEPDAWIKKHAPDMSRRGSPAPSEDRVEGEGQMTESRFLVRQGGEHGQWMVWDRDIRRPTKLKRGLASGLSEEQAQELLVRLRLAYGEE
jgi:hypothetical protein